MADFLVNFRTIGAEQAAGAARDLKTRLEQAAVANDRFDRGLQRRIGLIREETSQLSRQRAVSGAGFNQSGAGGGNGGFRAGVRAIASGGGGPLSQIGAVLSQASGGLALLGGVALGATALFKTFANGLANAEKNLEAFNTKLITLRNTTDDANKAQGKAGISAIEKSGAPLRRVALSGNKDLIAAVMKSPELLAAAATALGTKSSDQVLQAVKAAQEAADTGLTDSGSAFKASLASGLSGGSDEAIARVIRRTGQRTVSADTVANAREQGRSGGLAGDIAFTQRNIEERNRLQFQGSITAGTSGAGGRSLSDDIFAAQNPIRAAQEAGIEAMRRNTAALEAGAAAEGRVMEGMRETLRLVGEAVTFGTGEFDGSKRRQFQREQSQISQAARTIEAQ